MEQSRCVLTERDIQLLIFIWKFKLATTEVLIRAFFPDILPSTANNRILKLVANDYIRCCWIEGRPRGVFANLWGVTKKGFKTVRNYYWCHNLKAFYKPVSIAHDFLVAALHVGEWPQAPEGVYRISEQELRALGTEFWTERGLPPVESHRPDGYILTKINDKIYTVALEVELNQKPYGKYQDIVTAYDESKVDKVLWLVAYRGLARRIQSEFLQRTNSHPTKHNFISFKAFQKLGWQTPIMDGSDRGRTVRELIEYNPTNDPSLVVGLPYFNLSRSHKKLGTYTDFSLKSFSGFL